MAFRYGGRAQRFGSFDNHERQRYGYRLPSFGRRRGPPPPPDQGIQQQQRRRDLLRQIIRPRHRQPQHHHQHRRAPVAADHWRKVSSITGYVVVKRLKVGGLSESIKVVRHRRTHDLRVIKRVGSSARPKEELEILKRIPKYCHLNFMVEYCWLNRKEVQLVLEYCDLGDLGSLLEHNIKYRKSFPEDFVWHTMHDIGKALAFLHSGITDPSRQAHSQTHWDTVCHLDIKPANIFMSSRGGTRKHPRMVLGDFGCCVTRRDVSSGRESKQSHQHGTPQWFPPHSLSNVVGYRNQAYGWHTDIWQLGAVATCLCRLTFKPIREQVFRDYSLPCGYKYSSRLNNAVRSCVRVDKSRRPRAAALVRGIGRR